MNGNYRVGDTVLGEWKLSKLLGQGSYGKVFEGEREDFGIVYKAAIKIITIPQSQSEIQSTRAEGMDDASITAYFRSMVEEMVQEFGIMSKLKGNSNIVSYEDHRVIPHTEGIGWDIIIRMECLRPMLDYMGGRVLEPKEVAKVGVDMCKALELCAMQNIIHRDIKPENMFVNDLGDFKLGDFGIARTIERKVSNMSKKGTYTYMAPEIYKEEPYSALVDIYSLGIVLYRLLNNNRAPFLPLTGPITHGQREQALLRRISGAPLPMPCGDSGTLAQIVLRACAYRPEDRWQSPSDMRQALERYLIAGEIPVEGPAAEEEEEEGTVFAPRPPLRPRPAAEEEGTVFSPPPPRPAMPEEDEGTVSAVGYHAPAPTPAAPSRPAPAPTAPEEDEGTVSAVGYRAPAPTPAAPSRPAPAPTAPEEDEGTVSAVGYHAPAPAPTPSPAPAAPAFISPSAVAKPQAASPVAPASVPATPTAAPVTQAPVRPTQPEPTPAVPAAPPTTREEPASAPAPERPESAKRGEERKKPDAPAKKKTGLVIGIVAAVLVLGAVLALWLGGVFAPAPAPTPSPAPVPTEVAATPLPATPSPSPTPNYVDDDWSDTPVYSGG